MTTGAGAPASGGPVPYITRNFTTDTEVDDMFCHACRRICYWVNEGSWGYFVCPEHGRQN